VQSKKKIQEYKGAKKKRERILSQLLECSWREKRKTKDGRREMLRGCAAEGGMKVGSRGKSSTTEKEAESGCATH